MNQATLTILQYNVRYRKLVILNSYQVLRSIAAVGGISKFYQPFKASNLFNSEVAKGSSEKGST